MHLSPSSYYCPFLRLKYLPQHLVVKQPQAMFFPSCDTPSVTPIQNNWRNYISEYFVYISTFITLLSGYQQYVADGLKIDVSEALSLHSTADIYSMRTLILKF